MTAPRDDRDDEARPPSERWPPLRAVSGLATAAGAAAGGLLLAAIGLILADLVVRNVTGRSIAGVTEIASWLMAGMGWLALSYALRVDGHIEVRVLADRLPQRAQRPLSVVLSAVAFGFMLLLLRAMFDRFDYFLGTGTRGVETGYPTWWVYAVVLAGAGLFTLQFLVRLVDDWAAWRRERRQAAT